MLAFQVPGPSAGQWQEDGSPLSSPNNYDFFQPIYISILFTLRKKSL